MKQVLFLVAIYSLVFYQSQKNKNHKKTIPEVQQSIAQAAAVSMKTLGQDLQAPGFRYANINTLNRTGSAVTRTRWDERQ